jgi:hypothetical protein
MLLTGFDAPVEQVMYVDAPLREHLLLQAIARTNRIADGNAWRQPARAIAAIRCCPKNSPVAFLC